MLALGAATASLSAMLAGSAALAQPIPGDYGSLTFLFKNNIPGNPPPTGTPEYWLKAVVRPLVVDTTPQTGTIFIDLISNLQSPSEFIGSVGFNVTDPITNLQASCWDASSIGCSKSTSLIPGTSALKAEYLFDQPPKLDLQNNAKGFDLKISLPSNGNNGNRLQNNEQATFMLTGDGLTPAYFDATNEPYKNGTIEGLYTAAHIQGIPGGYSTTITDPESAPGPLPLLGAGVALGFSRRLRQRLSLKAAAV